MYTYYSYLVVPVVLFIQLLPYFTYASSESNGHGKNGEDALRCLRFR